MCVCVFLFLSTRLFFSFKPSVPSLVSSVLRTLQFALLTEDEHALFCIPRAFIYTFVSSFTFILTHYPPPYIGRQSPPHVYRL